MARARKTQIQVFAVEPFHCAFEHVRILLGGSSPRVFPRRRALSLPSVSIVSRETGGLVGNFPDMASSPGRRCSAAVR